MKYPKAMGLPQHLALVGVMLMLVASAWAGTVSTTNDSGPGSLRQAILDAAAGDTIDFGVTGTITLTSGVLSINQSLTISGPGADGLAVSGNNLSRVFRIGGGTTVSISGLTIENGYYPNYRAEGGGGIWNGGTLTITKSSFSGNFSGGWGGGIANFGTLTVGDCTVVNNSASYNGNGIANFGALTLTHSMISSNLGGYEGAGIWNFGGMVTLTNSTVSDNPAAYSGGGIWNDNNGTLMVIDSTLSGNSASGFGGGIYNSVGTVIVMGSTFTDNSAGVYGGGGIFSNGSATVVNSTFADNSSYFGGGIRNGGILTLANSTLAGNSVAFVGLSGGGLYNNGDATLKNTIIANSPLGGNCISASGMINSEGHNLSDDTTCSTFFTQISDLNGSPAGLDPSGLQDNGGPTQTIALLAGSPAVDAIPMGQCTDVAGNPVTTDQRSIERPQGPACDIGAVERVENSPPIVTSTSGPTSPIALGGLAGVAADFTDLNSTDVHTCSIAWGDSTSGAGVVSEANGSGICTGYHQYTATGVYAVTFAITDTDGTTGTGMFQFVVIYEACPSSIVSNFNGTAISAGGYIWFNSAMKVGGLGSGPTTIYLDNATIQFSAGGTNYNLSVPPATITFSPTATAATTTFDGTRWVTVVPSGIGGNTFLTGLSFPVPVNLPGGINPVTWSGSFTTDTPGVSVNWQWAAAVYRCFGTSDGALGVKPVDSNSASVYKNSDHAGTPENFKSCLISGARGGGGSNFTGGYSGTASKQPCPAQ